MENVQTLRLENCIVVITIRVIISYNTIINLLLLLLIAMGQS